jgi:hypothetical protein
MFVGDPLPCLSGMLIASHAIDALYLRVADFRAFFDDRTTRLHNLVGAAMGKALIRVQEAPAGDNPNTFVIEVDPDDGDSNQ